MNTPELTEQSRRLSADLTGPRHPERCQSCGASERDPEPAELQRWREHNHRDRPEKILVILCAPCAKALIDPHPRLYEPVHRWQPWPGTMPLCVDCIHRDGLRCQHPDLKDNGGSGLEIRFPQPERFHILTRPRENSGWRLAWKGPVSQCAGRETAGESLVTQ